MNRRHIEKVKHLWENEMEKLSKQIQRKTYRLMELRADYEKEFGVPENKGEKNA